MADAKTVATRGSDGWTDGSRYTDKESQEKNNSGEPDIYCIRHKIKRQEYKREMQTSTQNVQGMVLGFSYTDISKQSKEKKAVQSHDASILN